MSMEDNNIKYSASYCMGLVGYEVGLSTDGETVYYRYVTPAGAQNSQRAKVRYTSKGRAYFLANGRRIHLDECLRYNI